MSAMFTSAPWELCDLGDYGDFDGNSRVILGDDMRIAVVQVGGNEAECNANARLITAAPGLYEYVRRSAQGGCATAQALIAKICVEPSGA